MKYDRREAIVFYSHQRARVGRPDQLPEIMSLIREERENDTFPFPWSKRPTRTFATLSRRTIHGHIGVENLDER